MVKTQFPTLEETVRNGFADADAGDLGHQAAGGPGHELFPFLGRNHTQP